MKSILSLPKLGFGLSYWAANVAKLGSEVVQISAAQPLPLLELTLNDEPFDCQRLTAELSQFFPETRTLFHTYHLNSGGNRLVLENIPRVKEIVRALKSPWYAEDVCFEEFQGVQLPHMGLPFLPFKQLLKRFCQNIQQLNSELEVPILLEHTPVIVARPGVKIFDSFNFLAEAAEQTGNGLLLDLGHVYAICHNYGLDFEGVVNLFPTHLVVEIHFAGLKTVLKNKKSFLIDDHSQMPLPAVLTFLEQGLKQQKWPNLKAIIFESYDLEVAQFVANYQLLTNTVNWSPVVETEPVYFEAETGNLLRSELISSRLVSVSAEEDQGLHQFYTYLLLNRTFLAEYLDCFYKKELSLITFPVRLASFKTLPISIQWVRYFEDVNSADLFLLMQDFRLGLYDLARFSHPLLFKAAALVRGLPLDDLLDQYMAFLWSAEFLKDLTEVQNSLSVTDREYFRVHGGCYLLANCKFWTQQLVRNEAKLHSAPEPEQQPWFWLGLLDFLRVKQFLLHNSNLFSQLVQDCDFKKWNDWEIKLRQSFGLQVSEETGDASPGVITIVSAWNLPQLIGLTLDQPLGSTSLESNDLMGVSERYKINGPPQKFTFLLNLSKSSEQVTRLNNFCFDFY